MTENESFKKAQQNNEKSFHPSTHLSFCACASFIFIAYSTTMFADEKWKISLFASNVIYEDDLEHEKRSGKNSIDFFIRSHAPPEFPATSFCLFLPLIIKFSAVFAFNPFIYFSLPLPSSSSFFLWSDYKWMIKWKLMNCKSTSSWCRLWLFLWHFMVFIVLSLNNPNPSPHNK